MQKGTADLGSSSQVSGYSFPLEGFFGWQTHKIYKLWGLALSSSSILQGIPLSNLNHGKVYESQARYRSDRSHIELRW